MNKRTLRGITRLVAALALAGSLGLSVSTVLAADPPTSEERIKQLEERIKQLEGRADAMGGTAANPINKLNTLLEGVALSGYAESSYSWSSANNPGRTIVGRSFDRNDNQFMLNGVKLTLQRPVSTNKWDAGFRTDLLFGQNATLIQSSGLNLGGQGDIEQAYAEFMVPIGKE